MARPRADRWQGDAIIDGKRKRRSFKTRGEAETWEGMHPTEDKRFTSATPQADETMLGVANAEHRQIWESEEQGGAALRHVREAATIIGDLPFDRINGKHIAQLTTEYMRIGNAPATINRKFASLSKLFIHAIDTDRMTTAPRLKRREEPQGRERFLTRIEEAALFGELFKIRKEARDFAIFLVDTGARVGEAMKLPWTEVDLSTNRVTFTKTKNGLTRAIPLTARVVEILKARQGLDRPFADMNPWSFRDHWNRAKVASGFGADENVVPHILRHTCASRIVQGTGSLVFAQRFLGHKGTTMTNRYTHLAPDSLDGVVKLLDTYGT